MKGALPCLTYYDYECRHCGQKFEEMQTFEEHDRHEAHDRHQPLECPKCGSSKVESQVGASVFVITSKKS